MAKVTTNKATTSSTADNAASTNGLTARQRSLIATAQAKAAATQAQAEAEKAARVAPVTGTATGYDSTTGDWLIETPDGGTIRTQSLSNASLAGKRLPIQRSGDSQTASVNTPPTEADASWVVGEIEALQRDLYQLLAIESFPFRLDGQDDGTYVIDPYQHYPVLIEAIDGVSGATITVSPAVGEIAAVGSAISITVSGSELDTPVLGTLLLRRVG